MIELRYIHYTDNAHIIFKNCDSLRHIWVVSIKQII